MSFFEFINQIMKKPSTILIRHNVANIDNPDDVSYPFKLEVKLRQPDFMNFALSALYGSFEEIVILGLTDKDLKQTSIDNNLTFNPRLKEMMITGPDYKSEWNKDKKSWV